MAKEMLIDIIHRKTKEHKTISFNDPVPKGWRYANKIPYPKPRGVEAPEAVEMDKAEADAFQTFVEEAEELKDGEDTEKEELIKEIKALGGTAFSNYKLETLKAKLDELKKANN